MSPKTTSFTERQQAIVRETELQQQIEQQKIRRSTEADRLSLLYSSVNDLTQRLNSLKSRNTGIGIAQQIPQGESELKVATSKAAAQKTIVTELDQSITELEAELDHISNMRITLTADEIKKYYCTIEDAKLELLDIQSKIVEQQAIIAECDTANAGDLYNHRQNLLARSALGENLTDEIDQITIAITEKEQYLKNAADRRARATDTIDGLTRLAHEREQQLVNAQKQYEPLVKNYLIAERDKAVTTYLTVAHRLIDAYSSLLGLDRLVQTKGITPYLSEHQARLILPTPNNDETQSIVTKTQLSVTELIQREKERLQTTGITL